MRIMTYKKKFRCGNGSGTIIGLVKPFCDVMVTFEFQHVDNGCIISPMATLLPLSRGISLFSKFKVCVCTGNPFLLLILKFFLIT